MPLLTELNHIFLGVSINMTLLTELGVLKHYGLGNVTPERPCAKRVAAGGKVPPRPLPYGRGSDWARWLTAIQSDCDRISNMASDCFLAATKGILVGLGAAGGHDARAPRIANHGI